MKKYLFLFLFSSLLISCHTRKDDIEPEVPDELPCLCGDDWSVPYELPCRCGDEWPFEEFSCTNELPWYYPVIPGSDEWEQILTLEERIAVCEIPEEVLSSLSTEDLISIYMHNPFLGTIITEYPPEERGLDMFFTYYNGFRELFQREDVLKGLLNWYGWAMQNMSTILREETPMGEQVFLVGGIARMEVLLAHYQSQDTGNKEEYIKIMKCLYYVYENKLLYPVAFGALNIGYSLYSRAKTMIKIDEQILELIPGTYQNIIFFIPETYDRYDKQTRRVIDELSCQFIY